MRKLRLKISDNSPVFPTILNRTLKIDQSGALLPVKGCGLQYPKTLP